MYIYVYKYITLVHIYFTQESDVDFVWLSFCFDQIKSSTPILLCSVSGYDASGRVDDLAAQLGKQCTPIAIGKPNSSSKHVHLSLSLLLCVSSLACVRLC